MSTTSQMGQSHNNKKPRLVRKARDWVNESEWVEAHNGNRDPYTHKCAKMAQNSNSPWSRKTNHARSPTPTLRNQWWGWTHPSMTHKRNGDGWPWHRAHRDSMPNRPTDGAACRNTTLSTGIGTWRATLAVPPSVVPSPDPVAERNLACERYVATHTARRGSPRSVHRNSPAS